MKTSDNLFNQIIMFDTDRMAEIVVGALIVLAIAYYLYTLINGRQKKLSFLKISAQDKAHGIIFGKKGKKVVFSLENSEGSVGVFAATGAGKTTSIGIPTLRSWHGSLFVIDISGDIEKNCPDIHDKLTYAPGEDNGCVYNIFGCIDDLPSKEEQHEALEELVILLMPETADMNDAGRFFLLNGRKILTAALIKGYDEGKDFIDICRSFITKGYQDLFHDIDESRNSEAISYINSFEGSSEQNTAGCKQAADGAIKLFAINHNMRSVKRPSPEETDIVPKLIEDHSIFIKVPDDKLELYSPLLNIITSQVMQYISSRSVSNTSKTILMFLDEFASLRISAESIIAALRKYRKRKCRIMLLTQNLADLDMLYGNDTTRAIMSNLRFKVLLGGLAEPESQKYFAELIGYREVKKNSISHGEHTTRTESETREYVIEPADLDRQGKDVVILIYSEGYGSGYIILKKNFYFQD